MSNKKDGAQSVQITGLEEMLIDWGIDQALGSTIGPQVVKVINPIVSAIAGGANVEQALISVAISEVSGLKTNNATVEMLVPIVVQIATAVESGKTIIQALESVLTGLTVPSALASVPATA